MRRSFLATVAIVIAGPALAGPFDGTWDFDPASCGAAYSDTRVRISGNQIGFIESTCALGNPTSIREMDSAQLFDLQCSGEGQIWSERVLIGLSGENQLLLYSRGYASLRTRC